ncbi:MAG TPA: hypothetical protein VNH11_11410 [Pirellulales bacterium]|nr:hypothetical protein [Pirellulales bacterium]
MKAVSPVAPHTFRPQYALRSLLALVTLASVPLAVWASREHAYRALVATVTPLVKHGREVCVEKAGRGAESLRRIDSLGKLERHDVVVGAFCDISDRKEVAAILASPTLKELRLSEPGRDWIPGSLTELREAGLTGKAVQIGPYVTFGDEPAHGAIDPVLREVAGKLPSLEKLGLVATSISGEGLRHLTALRSLRLLDLSRTRISDSDLAHIPSMPALEELNLDMISAHLHGDPAALAKLRATFGPEVTSGHEITDEGLRRLAGASRLRVLRLREAKVAGVAFRHLASLTRLEELSLYQTDFNDDGARCLAALPSIRILDLTATKITSSALADISTMSQLSSLSLWATAVDDDSLRHLARLPCLSGLSLRETRITDAGLVHLAALPSLEVVDLAGAKSITAAGIARLQALRPNLNIGTTGGTVVDFGSTAVGTPLW